MTRRQFVRATVGMGFAAALGDAPRLLAQEAAPPAVERPKLIVVLVGGGTRSSETIDDPDHRYIPRLWREMIPRGTLFTNMRVDHKVVHPRRGV